MARARRMPTEVLPEAVGPRITGMGWLTHRWYKAAERKDKKAPGRSIAWNAPARSGRLRFGGALLERRVDGDLGCVVDVVLRHIRHDERLADLEVGGGHRLFVEAHRRLVVPAERGVGLLLGVVNRQVVLG